MSDRYGYIAIETLLNFCENSKDHAVTPNDFMRMARVQVPERKKGRWVRITQGAVPDIYMCPFCCRTIEDSGVENLFLVRFPFCHCGADMRGEQDATDRR